MEIIAERQSQHKLQAKQRIHFPARDIFEGKIQFSVLHGGTDCNETMGMFHLNAVGQLTI